MHYITINLLAEFYRRKQAVKADTRKFWTAVSKSTYWKEFAGVFQLYTRQTGKTTALKEFINQYKEIYPNDEVTFVAPSRKMLEEIDSLGDRNLSAEQGFEQLRGVHLDRNLLVIDEFMFLSPEDLSTLLNLSWKHVVGVGTLA